MTIAPPKLARVRNSIRAAVTGLTVGVLAVTATAAPAGAAPVHTVYNGLRYTNASYFDGYGAVPIVSFYDVWDMSCTTTSCSNIPSQSEFRSKLDAYVSDFRSSDWIVLDFEGLVVDAATSTQQAQKQVDTLLTFIEWTHEAYPDAQVGMYDYDWSPQYTESDYIAIRKQLYADGGLDFFAPTMYQRWSDIDTWDTNLEAAIANDAKIADKPSIAYVSPYVGGNTDSGLQSSADWTYQLSTADSELDGAIVWTQHSSSDTLDTGEQWVRDIVDYLE